MKKDTIIIGTRSSKLALWQAEYVKSRLEEEYPELTVKLKLMTTKGDKILDAPLAKIGGKGLFTKELENAMLEKRTDIAVHSLKDMPMEVPEELPLLAFSKREDPRDVLVLPEGVAELDPEKPLGCSSLRRTLQLKKLYPDMEVKSIRGNLQTRLRKLDSGGDPQASAASWLCRRRNAGSRSGADPDSGAVSKRSEKCHIVWLASFL